MSEQSTLLEQTPETEAQTEGQVDVAESTSAEAETQSSDVLLAGKYKTAEDLENAYKSLESKIGEKEEAIRERLKEEMSAPKEGVPATSGEYEIPDFIEEEEALASDALKNWADHCLESGYNQEEFKRGIELYMEAMPQRPNLEEEAKQLGEGANSRIEAASLFANKFFPQDAMSAVERMCEGADGIIALEAIMSAMKDPSVNIETGTADSLTENSLNEMMRDERYWNPRVRDDNYVKQVQSGFKKLYG